MDIYLVFNELSAITANSSKESNVYIAREWMSQLVNVITESHKNGIKALKTYEDFFETLLAEGYTIHNWLTDNIVDREQRRRIRSAGTAYQCLKKPQDASHLHLPEDIRLAETRMLEFEFKYNSKNALGIGSAYLLESIAVSLATRPEWNSVEITLDLAQYDEQIEDIVFRNEIIRHISATEHIAYHLNWCQNRLETSVTDGAYLLNHCSDWYSHLDFTDNVRSQIASFHGGTPQLRQAIKKLFELENYCKQWVSGPFDINQLASKASPESRTVRDDPSLRSQRIFRVGSGQEQFFEWHLRLTPDNWRLYFLPDPVQKRIYIGYIGPKLPTAKYRTL